MDLFQTAGTSPPEALRVLSRGFKSVRLEGAEPEQFKNLNLPPNIVVVRRGDGALWLVNTSTRVIPPLDGAA